MGKGTDRSKWIEQEGICSPDFLHLEDLRAGAPSVGSIKSSEGDIITGDSVLEVLYDFYKELYSKKDTHCEDEILNFLHNIPEIPKITPAEVNVMGKPITKDEVLQAIGKLKMGKAPGRWFDNGFI